MQGHETKIFVLEHSENATAHQWNTRLDDSMYKKHAIGLATAIKSKVPNCEIVFNKVPKMHAMADIYCQLIPNEDDSIRDYDIVPRLWSFELSYNGVLIFSKLLSKMWPNYTAVADRCAAIAVANDNNEDITMMQTTGQGTRVPPKKKLLPHQMVQSQSSGKPQGPAQTMPQTMTYAAEPVQAQVVQEEAPVAQVEEAAQKADVGGPKEFGDDANELEHYSNFFPAGTKSSLSKNMTEEIWEEYKNQKDASGVSFKTCVFSGIKNLDSGIGLYAGSEDSYTKWNKLFDAVISDYHGHGLADKHITDMDAKSLKNADFSEADAAMVVSTRIRVGRNCHGFPLGPGVSKDQRLEIMNKVVEACNTFEGDLKGTFYPLEGMSKENQQQLIDDHFLFKEGDRFLKACNLNRDWPSGRGIFHNNDKTFLVWVNEEDQLRIISMQPGAGIAEVFDRLSRAAAHIETVLKFSRNDHLGYITSCPTNLGTALRASVHIKLPKLMKNKQLFNEIADKFYVQIRGIHGEHTETDDGTFDISNRRRLGRSEKDLVQDMIDGVHALITAENAEQ